LKNDQLDGRSLLPLMQGQEKWNHHALSFYGEGNIAVRGEKFRLIQYEDGSQELYDLKNDPNEWINLADKKEYKDQIKSLSKSIPKQWAALSPYSKYEFNEYFKQKSK
jgi:arylsulfatase A-like enzyme